MLRESSRGQLRAQGELFPARAEHSSGAFSQIETLVATQGVLYAIGGALLYLPSISYMSEWFVEKRGMANGVIFAGKYICSSFSPRLRIFVCRHSGWRFDTAADSSTLDSYVRGVQGSPHALSWHCGCSRTCTSFYSWSPPGIACAGASISQHTRPDMAEKSSLLDLHGRKHSARICVFCASYLVAK